MTSILRRLWRHRLYAQPLLPSAEHPFILLRPIPLAERQPGPGDLGGFDSDCCWWGYWQGDRWFWIWDAEPVRGETHWLPASVKILPTRCCVPEVQP